MKPRTHYQHVEDTRILFFYILINAQGAEQVFIVIPTADGHDRGVNVL